MIGDNIKRYRKESGLTQKQLADQLGLAEITIRQYEGNKREPKLDLLPKIAEALNISTMQLVSVPIGEQAISPSRHRSAFIEFLVSMGYEFIDLSLLDEDANECIIRSSNPDFEIRLSAEDLDDLEGSLEANLDLELYKLRKRKGI